MSWQGLARVVRDRDPGWFSVHRGLRLALVVTIAFGFAFQIIGNPQTATFAAFGSFALLLFADFHGSSGQRLAAFLTLAGFGVISIVLGTLASRPSWLAVVAMALDGFVVIFAGVVSSTAAGATRAALLVFILPVTLPGSAGDIGPRLFGWAIAVVLCVPAALLIWPPRQSDKLRSTAAATCRALAQVLATRDEDERSTATASGAAALDSLRQTFRATESRPAGLTTGSRALVRMVDDLEWLTPLVTHTRVTDWPPTARGVADAAADVLARSGDALAGVPGATAATVDDALERLTRTRRQLARDTADVLSGAADAADVPPYRAQELSYAAGLVGEAAAVASAADARPVLQRLLGARPREATASALLAAERIVVPHVNPRSVWLRNSIRGALGLAVAVLVAKLTSQQHVFWVALGAMSVLRSNAVATGSTVLRAILGTLIGFGIGGVLVQLIGISPAVLWPLLPVVVFCAAVAPDLISFIAGQAAFTVAVVILFNIIAPLGWQVGLLRFEDVVLGCAASLLVGVLLWPRGASGALGVALADGYRRALDYLGTAVQSLNTGRAAGMGANTAARAAAARLDDAFRQYLAERGPKQVPLGSLTLLANGASRVRLAADAISALCPDDRAADLQGTFGSGQSVLGAQLDTVQAWYGELADSLDRSDSGAVPAPAPATGERQLVDALGPSVSASSSSGTTDAVVAQQARRLLWAGQYLDELNRFEARLAGPAGEVNGQIVKPWWR